MTTTIEIEGLAALEKKLGKLAAREAMMPAMRRSCERIRSGLVKYPPVPSAADKARAVAAWTPKQRRWFFANLRAGSISIPYRRTGKLGQAWTTKIERIASGLLGIVGNVRSYGPWVQDADRQALIHQGRWPTVQKVAREQEAKIGQDFEQEIARLIAS